MEIIKLEEFSFFYPDSKTPSLDCLNLSVEQGDFVEVCGSSGSGKTTLLKTLKPELAPFGKKNGRLLFCGEEAENVNFSKIGFVVQNPDNQIVTDTVWQELCFGLENMGMNQNEMQIRIAEIATFFGIEKWFYKNTSELSGGQKQILNLASIMAMEPELLILDEPTSQLSPISAGDFFSALYKINRELGTTVILSEHRTEDIFSYANRVVVMDNGRIIADCTPKTVGRLLKDTENPMFSAMPAPVRIFESIVGNGDCPVTVSEARNLLSHYINNCNTSAVFLPKRKKTHSDKTAISAKNFSYRYDKTSGYVLSDLTLTVKKGEIFGILGGNGVGKSTLLWLLSGALKLQKGKLKTYGKIAMLPQNPETLFVKNTVKDELMSIATEECADDIMDTFGIKELSSRHPFDLSGGEQQKLALCKLFLTNPDILLLDEPTKGLDAPFKQEFSELLYSLQEKSITIIMVSHDIEFCAKMCDRCGLLFDGKVVSEGAPKDFFRGKKFYTTQTARIFRGFSDEVILADDAIEILKFLEDKK